MSFGSSILGDSIYASSEGGIQYPVESALEVSWNVEAYVQSQLPVTYNVVNGLEASLTCSYTIVSVAAFSLSASWDIDNEVSSSLIAIWDINQLSEFTNENNKFKLPCVDRNKPFCV
jgi:hypothetical protein